MSEATREHSPAAGGDRSEGSTGAERRSAGGSDERSAPRDGAPRRTHGFTSAPSRTGWGLTVGFALVAALPVAITGLPALAAGAGLLGLVAGLRRESGRAVGLGAAALLAGVLAAGAYGLGPEGVLAATAGALLAYDAADNALSVGEQVGRAGPTARLELVHSAGMTVLVATGGTVAYAAFRAVGGGQPSLALLLFVVGAVTLSAALR